VFVNINNIRRPASFSRASFFARRLKQCVIGIILGQHFVSGRFGTAGAEGQ
jgi:hypothetical protein